MGILLNPYISLQGTAREAVEFYRSIFGGTVEINTFGESGMPTEPGYEDKVMHSMLQADGLVLMVSDTPPGMPHTPGNTISISLSGDDEATLRRYFEGLSAGGTIVVPLDKAPWGDIFGMCVDTFGIVWMVNVTAA